MTIPPEWIPRCRGASSTCRARSTTGWGIPCSGVFAVDVTVPHPSTRFDHASCWPGAWPSALAMSRTADFARYVMTLATCAVWWRPCVRYTYWMTSSRRSLSMSMSMSGGPSRSGDRKRSNSRPSDTASAAVTPMA